MVQESVMIAVDNSEWMRNGDLTPTRLQCQQDAVNFMLHSKLRANPENGVGLLSMSPNVEVLSTITRDDRKLFMKLHGIVVEGNCKLFNAIKIAHLALRHRQNRNHKMRIIVFVGSPVLDVDHNEFIRLAKKLKKEKVNVDFVCFGEASQNDGDEKLLQEFVDTLNTKDTEHSHLLAVNAGLKLVEALVSSPICYNEDGEPMGGGAAGGMDFGNMEEDDPELALALRVSLEEQRQRQLREDAANAPAAAEPAAPADSAAPAAAAPAQLSEYDEQLATALRLSLEQHQQSTSGADEMEVDATQEEGVGGLLEDPDLLAQMVEDLPEDSQKKPDKKDSTD